MPFLLAFNPSVIQLATTPPVGLGISIPFRHFVRLNRGVSARDFVSSWCAASLARNNCVGVLCNIETPHSWFSNRCGQISNLNGKGSCCTRDTNFCWNRSRQRRANRLTDANAAMVSRVYGTSDCVVADGGCSGCDCDCFCHSASAKGCWPRRKTHLCRNTTLARNATVWTRLPVVTAVPPPKSGAIPAIGCRANLPLSPPAESCQTVHVT